MVFTIASICLVASPERSASRCTSSATTVKPRPASPAEAAWIAAFSASTLVCSVMSEISSTISPISIDDSPSRLIRLDVSWICVRISFMPAIWFCTACAALFGGGQRLLRNPGRLGGGLRHLVDRLRHLQHRRGGLLDLPVLPLRRLEQPVGDRLRFLRRLGHLVGRGVDAAHQRAQFLDREVDRVGDGAGHVLGHRRLHGQVAVGEVAHLVQQPQNGFLVALVLALRSRRRAAARRRGTPCRAGPASAARAAQRRSRRHSVNVRAPARPRRAAASLVGVGEERLRLGVDRARRLLRDRQALHVLRSIADAPAS